MRIYEDRERTKALKLIHFGKVKAGESKVLTLFLFNDSKAVLTNLLYEFPGLPPGEVLEVVEGPITIQPGKLEKLVLKWSPSRNFRKALEVGLLIKGEEVYVAKKRFAVTK